MLISIEGAGPSSNSEFGGYDFAAKNESLDDVAQKMCNRVSAAPSFLASLGCKI